MTMNVTKRDLLVGLAPVALVGAILWPGYHPAVPPPAPSLSAEVAAWRTHLACIKQADVDWLKVFDVATGTQDAMLENAITALNSGRPVPALPHSPPLPKLSDYEARCG
jgi:hypothetical protein